MALFVLKNIPVARLHERSGYGFRGIDDRFVIRGAGTSRGGPVAPAMLAMAVADQATVAMP
jgi:hypothetical protein